MKASSKFKLLILVICLVIVVMAIGLTTTAFAAKKACNDGLDNDGDGYIDRADPGCANPGDSSELNPNIECDDGSDNDGDNAIDYNDGGCTGPTDNDETDCGDGVCEGGEVCDVCVADCGYCDSCSDTDGGWNVMVQGTVSGYDNGSPYKYTDFCIENSTLVMEYYCLGDSWGSSTYDCDTGNFTTSCSNGACV